MKKIISLLMTMLLLCCSACAAPTNDASQEQTFTENNAENTADELDFLPLDFYFTSGAGGWGTELTLNPNGSFTGKYHDSDMGSTGEGYQGTYYLCRFAGRFESITKVNDFTYTMTLGEIYFKEEIGKEWIEDGVRYIASEPYGLAGSEEFWLFTPDTPTAELSEEFLSWWPGRYDEARSETLDHYGIMNTEREYGFFSN